MGKKILVADDEPHVIQLLSSRLRANGYEVATACDGQQCVKIAHEENPDLIILDLVMPKGGGIYAFARLKASPMTTAIPLIFLTAYPQEALRKEVLEMGAEDFVAKPFDSDDLLKKVRKALGKKREPLRKERAPRSSNLGREPGSKKEEKGKKILVVDDDLRMVKLLASRLKANEYEVKVAYDGCQCIEVACQERPDLILLDIAMPAGDGLSTFEKLRTIPDTAAIPVIFITAYPSEESESEAFEMGAKAFIPKPIDSSDLLWKVRRALGEEP